MKKYRRIFVLLCSLFLLSGCRTSTNTLDLSTLKWKLEYVDDRTEITSVQESTKDYPTGNYKNVSCACDENGNILITDETERKSWSGKYSLKLSDKETQAYELTFPDCISAIGILGKRQYEDGRTVDSFTIYTDDKVISFLSDEI